MKKQPASVDIGACQFDKLADLLAETLGPSQARTLLRDAATALGLRSADLSPDDADAVLRRLAAMPGLVGIAAQMARTRLRLAVLRHNLSSK